METATMRRTRGREVWGGTRSKRTISLIIPAYNEEARIGQTLKLYHRGLVSYGFDFEIIVVMDGCADRTPEIVQHFADDQENVVPVYYARKLGKGGAICAALREVRGDVVAIADADCATPPEELLRLIVSLGDADGVIGSRYVKGSERERLPVARFIASRGFNMLVRLMFGLRFADTQCGAKVFRADVLRSACDSTMVSGFAFDVDLLVRIVRAGGVIRELPIHWDHIGNSSLSLKRDVVGMARELVAIFVHDTKLRLSWPTATARFDRTEMYSIHTRRGR